MSDSALPDSAAATPATHPSPEGGVDAAASDSAASTDESTEQSQQGFGVMPPAEGKPPLPVLAQLVAFPPNRQTLGGTSYLIETSEGNVLVDSPPWTLTIQAYLSDRGVRWFFLTHRNAMAKVKAIQAALNCEIVVQEQEAYLLPELETTSFHRELAIAEGVTALWTPGYSPGAACLHWATQDGGVLFTGRHLLPNRQGGIMPLRTSKTFHWPRQLRSLVTLRERINGETLRYLCPGASIGFLRGEHKLDQAWEKLQALDLETLAQAPIGP